MSVTNAWILLSLEHASSSGSATLERVVATADMINHTVPSADELLSALNGLMGLGLVSTSGAVAALTEEGTTLVAGIRSNLGERPSWIQQLRALAEVLERHDSPRPGSGVGGSLPTVEQTQSAVDAYLARHQHTAQLASSLYEAQLRVLGAKPEGAARRLIRKLTGRSGP